MKTQSVSLPLSADKTGLWAVLFVAGNLALPQLCHTVGMGGRALLPILFFTLIAAARYGWACGLITALLSPLASSLLFGMPEGIMLGVLTIKSVVLASIIGLAVRQTGRFSLTIGLSAIAAYQLAGFVSLGLMGGSWSAAWGDVLVSWPAVLLQGVAIAALLTFQRRKA
jgi:hypothetical protein